MDPTALLEALDDWLPRLCACTAQDADVVVGSKWNRKELLGHLVDSATNNRQRFIRLRHGDLEGFPGYDQEEWVVAGGYRECDWNELVELWFLSNRHVARVIEGLPAGCEGHLWKDTGFSLEYLVHDYTRHLLHHLGKMRLGP